MARRVRGAKAPIERVIGDIESLRVISDPLRLKLLELTSADPSRAWSAKEMAASLGTSQTKLYHHLGLLEEHGFLRVAETRVVSGITERRYSATAHGYRVDRTLLTGSAAEAAVSDTLDAIFNKARVEIMAGIHDGLIEGSAEASPERRMAMWSSAARLSPRSVARVVRLIEQLNEVADTEEDQGRPYGLLVAFYPRSDSDGDTER